jgi:hypothetical protein
MQHYIIDHPLHSCFVKPVWSPLESCSVLANVNYDLNGSPLRYENKRLRGSRYEAVIYTAGPLAFHPPDCSKTLLMPQTIMNYPPSTILRFIDYYYVVAMICLCINISFQF